MKKLFLTLLAVLSLATLSAQPHGNRHNNHGSVPPPPPATPSIVVEAQQGETFVVYLNGDQVNNVPKSQVVVDRLDNQMQDIIVVLNHPVRKAGIIQAYATVEGTRVTVSYDPRAQRMLLYTPRQSVASGDPHRHVTPPMPPTPPTPPIIVPEEPATVSDAWVGEMVGLINAQSFDSEKLNTAKGLLNNGRPFTVDQIVRITRALAFSNSQVDFLKAAYRHCIDPENYERALAILTFSSDRQKVRKYIDSLR
jgi:hypothetical protein